MVQKARYTKTLTKYANKRQNMQKYHFEAIFGGEVIIFFFERIFSYISLVSWVDMNT